MRKRCLKEIYELAKRDPRVVFVGSDLGPNAMDEFKRDFPDRFFMEGVSEQFLTGMLAGMAKEGFIPYYNTIAVFVYRRCLEQVIIDIAMPNLPVRLTGSGGGFVYVPLGPTHLAVDDIAIMRTIPNMTIVAPADEGEMARLIRVSATWPGPMYIRIAKGGDPIVTPPDNNFQIGKALLIEKGNDVLLVTTGITLSIALSAAESLKNQKVSAAILHMSTIKPIDMDALCESTSKVRAIVTIEEGTIIGGLGSAVCEVLSDQKLLRSRLLTRIGSGDEFTEHYGSQAKLMESYGITSQNVVEKVMDLLGKV